MSVCCVVRFRSVGNCECLCCVVRFRSVGNCECLCCVVRFRSVGNCECLCIGYITRWRSVWDLHNRGPKARG